MRCLDVLAMLAVLAGLLCLLGPGILWVVDGWIATTQAAPSLATRAWCVSSHPAIHPSSVQLSVVRVFVVSCLACCLQVGKDGKAFKDGPWRMLAGDELAPHLCVQPSVHPSAHPRVRPSPRAPYLCVRPCVRPSVRSPIHLCICASVAALSNLLCLCRTNLTLCQKCHAKWRHIMSRWRSESANVLHRPPFSSLHRCVYIYIRVGISCTRCQSRTS